MQSVINSQSMDVSVEKLLALINTSDEMIKSILGRDRAATLANVAQRVHDLLDAESAAIFLVPEHSPRELVLAARYTDKYCFAFEAKPVKIQSEKGYSFVGHVANQGHNVELHGEELTQNEYIADHRAPYLHSGRSLSILAIPLKNHKGRVVGLVKLDNKKNSDGVPDDHTFFNQADEFMARLLANKIVVVLDNLRASDTIEAVLGAIHEEKSSSEVLSTILSKGLMLLGADRGEIALWDDAMGNLVISHQCGHGKNLCVGSQVAEKGLIRQVWDSGEARLCGDVSHEPDYVECDSRTQSEVVARLEWEHQRIGVFNAESFDKDGFNEQDLELLKDLGKYASIAIEVTQRQNYFHEIVERVADGTPSWNEILTDILESVKTIHGFDSGIIYMAEPTNRLLRGMATIGCEALKHDPTKIAYRFDEVALATKVFNEKAPYFSQSPKTDVNVNQQGREEFNIAGPLLGVPLIFKEKTLGVLVVWSQNEKHPTKTHKQSLAPFAHLAAVIVELAENSFQRSVVLDEVRTILAQMQTQTNLEENLLRIMHGVQVAGFDRVRVLEYKAEARCFVVINSLGMDKPEKIKDLVIYLDKNDYAKDTAETALEWPRARLYCANGAHGQSFGPDPQAHALDKSDRTPWAVVPLVIAGKLYGKIVADNEESHREITQASLEHLTLLGSLAAQAIANAGTIEMLRVGYELPILYRQIGIEDPKALVLRRFLVYLTCGEAMGFSRALFLELDQESREFHYSVGLGQVTSDRFAEVAPYAKTEGLERLLNRAGELSDPELDARMDNFRLSVDEPSIKEFLQQAAAKEQTFKQQTIDPESPEDFQEPCPSWVREVATRIDALAFLVVQIKMGDGGTGLLIVDRRWQPRGLNDADLQSLSLFAQQASQILGQHELHHQVFASRSMEALAWVAKGLTHELRHPLGTLRSDTYIFRKAVKDKKYRDANQSAKRIEQEVTELVSIVNALESLVRTQDQFAETNASDLFQDLGALCRKRAEAHNIAFLVKISPNLPPFQAIRGLLHHALINLVANAQTALEQSNTLGGQIVVEAYREHDGIVLQVKDNGPGIAPYIFEKIRGNQVGVTSNSQRGLGIGLSFVRRVAKVHNGTFEIQTDSGKGTIATLRIPSSLPRKT